MPQTETPPEQWVDFNIVLPPKTVKTLEEATTNWDPVDLFGRIVEATAAAIADAVQDDADAQNAQEVEFHATFNPRSSANDESTRN